MYLCKESFLPLVFSINITKMMELLILTYYILFIITFFTAVAKCEQNPETENRHKSTKMCRLVSKLAHTELFIFIIISFSVICRFLPRQFLYFQEIGSFLLAITFKVDQNLFWECKARKLYGRTTDRHFGT